MGVCPQCGSAEARDGDMACGTCRLRAQVASIAGGDQTEWVCCSDAVQVLSAEGDAAKGTLMRVRQLAMWTDRINLHNRLYPRAVVTAAMTAARERAQSGAMLSEYQHPDVAEVDGRESFIDRPDQKTARVDDIHGPDDQGRVFVDRSILNVPAGRRIAEANRQGRPKGLSTRFRMTGDYAVADNRECLVAATFDLSTWDDVDQAAFADADKERVLLTDSQLAALQPSVTPQADPAADRPNGTGPRGSTAVPAHARTADRNEDCNVKLARVKRALFCGPRVAVIGGGHGAR